MRNDMATGDINILMGCEECRYADAYGRGCKHGLLFPVLSLMVGYNKCPNFEVKTSEQIKEQLNIKVL